MTDRTAQAGITLSANSLNTDPMLENPDARDFTPKAASPAVDAALSLSDVTLDHLGCGRPRGAGVDVGAIER